MNRQTLQEKLLKWKLVSVKVQTRARMKQKEDQFSKLELELAESLIEVKQSVMYPITIKEKQYVGSLVSAQSVYAGVF